jgi:adenylate cyclase
MRLRRGCAVGLLAGGLGAALAATPYGWAVEERLGLSWLFGVRGPLEAPAETTVISLNRESAERLHLPEKIREWPRAVYARLIERLVAAGAAVIVFDVNFDQPRAPADDRELAQTISATGRIVLLEYLNEDFRWLPGRDGGIAGLLAGKQLRPPLPAFVEGAVGVAPFPLPRATERVSQFFAFASDLDDRPTLPAVALQRYALPVLADWSRLLSGAGLAVGQEDLVAAPGQLGTAEALRAYMQALRRAFVADPGLGARLRAALAGAGLDADTRRRLAALIALYDGPDGRYLNFYGPVGQIRTIPLHQALEVVTGGSLDLAGNVVFVGQSEPINANQDGFATVFEGPRSARMGGVEIAATALANLLEGRTLEPAGPGVRLLWMLGFGGLVGLIGGLLPALLAVPLALAAAGLGYLGAQLAFVQASLWLPVALPLLVQLPFGLFLGLLLQYRESQRARANISRGLGYYLPARIAAALEQARVDPRTVKEELFAACMVTDAHRFTSLAEGMTPDRLSGYLDRYFETLFGVVERHGGLVTDVVGDGMTCVWTMPAPDCRRRACLAALEIDREVVELNRRLEPLVLPTRIGLNAGRVMVGNVGGGRRFAYSVVGDPVNTAARIEGLNKQLGTRILATDVVALGLPELLLRPLGRFLPVGKSRPLRLVEIVGRQGEPHDACLLEAFARGLARFEAGCWNEAAACFEAILAEHPSDGPARFYVERCRRPQGGAAPPTEPGLIRLEHK